MKIKNLIDDYYKSVDFKELRDGTKEQYKYFLQVVMDTNVENKNLGSIKSLLLRRIQRGDHILNISSYKIYAGI